MGGAFGRLPHIFDDYDLTVEQIIEILDLVYRRSTHVFEKIDGINMMFSVDNDNVIKFARSEEHMSSGGVSKEEICRSIKDQELSKIILSYLEIWESFLNDRRTFKSDFKSNWGSFEIVIKDFYNVIQYDKDCIVIHPMMLKDGSWIPYMKKGYSMNVLFESTIPIFGANFYGYGDYMHSSIYSTAVENLKRLPRKLLLKEELKSTVRDIYKRTLAYEIFDKGFSMELSEKIAENLLRLPGYSDTKKLSKNLYEKQKEALKEIVSKRADYVKFAKRDLQNILDKFGARLSTPFKSFLIEDHSKSSAILMNKFLDVIEEQKETKENRQIISKIKYIGSSNVNIEGVVIWYPSTNKYYKITGLFRFIQRKIGFDVNKTD